MSRAARSCAWPASPWWSTPAACCAARERLSKRGLPLLRKHAFMLALRSVRRDGIFRAEFEAMLERNGGKRKKAVVSLSRRMLRLMYSVARERRRYTAEPPQAAPLHRRAAPGSAAGVRGVDRSTPGATGTRSRASDRRDPSGIRFRRYNCSPAVPGSLKSPMRGFRGTHPGVRRLRGHETFELREPLPVRPAGACLTSDLLRYAAPQSETGRGWRMGERSAGVGPEEHPRRNSGLRCTGRLHPRGLAWIRGSG